MTTISLNDFFSFSVYTYFQHGSTIFFNIFFSPRFSTAVHDNVTTVRRDDVSRHVVTDLMSFTNIPRGRGPGSVLINTHVQFHCPRSAPIHSSERRGYSTIVPPGGVRRAGDLSGDTSVKPTTHWSLGFRSWNWTGWWSCRWNRKRNAPCEYFEEKQTIFGDTSCLGPVPVKICFVCRKT